MLFLPKISLLPKLKLIEISFWYFFEKWLFLSQIVSVIKKIKQLKSTENYKEKSDDMNSNLAF